MLIHSIRSILPTAVWLSGLFAAFAPVGLASTTDAGQAPADEPVYTYKLTHNATPESYDEALAVACLQGIINRDRPRLYILSMTDGRPEYWRKILSDKGRRLDSGRIKSLRVGQ